MIKTVKWDFGIVTTISEPVSPELQAERFLISLSVEVFIHHLYLNLILKVTQGKLSESINEYKQTDQSKIWNKNQHKVKKS